MAVFDNLNYSTSAGLSASVVNFHTKKLLENMRPALIHTRDMQMVNLPLNNGRRVQFRKPVPLDARLDPLGEGVTPEGQKLKMTELWATIKPYGGHIEYTDELNWALYDNTTRLMDEQLSNQASLTLDCLARDAYNSGLNVQYAGGKGSRTALTATDKITYAEIKKAVRTLKNKNVKKFADGYYHAFLSPDATYDLTEDAMWIDVAKYQDKRKIETGELGVMAGVKFFESTNAKTFDAETYVVGTKTSLTIASGSYDAAKKQVTVSEALTDYECRCLIGKVVQLRGGASSAYKYATCLIENATTDKVITLRWAPTEEVVTALGSAAGAILPAGGGASGVTVASTVIYGQDFAGGVSLGGNGDNVQMIIKPVGSSGATDPLNQRGTVAWKVKGVAYTILQDDFGVRIEHAVSA